MNNKILIFFVKQLLFYCCSFPVTFIVFFNISWITTFGNFFHKYIFDISWLSRIIDFLLGFSDKSVDLNDLVFLFFKLSFIWYIFSSLFRYMFGKRFAIDIRTQIYIVSAVTIIGNIISMIYLRYASGGFGGLFWVVLIFSPISIGANIGLIYLNNLSDKIEQIK